MGAIFLGQLVREVSSVPQVPHTPSRPLYRFLPRVWYGLSLGHSCFLS